MLDRLLTRSPFAETIAHALDEAWRRGDRRLGTEHLLLGLLHDSASRPARALGTSLEAARAALDDLDTAALAALGINLGGLPPTAAGAGRRPPLTVGSMTSQARATLATLDNRHRTLDALLLALLNRQRPEPVAELLASLRISTDDVRDRLSETTQQEALPQDPDGS